MKKWSDFFVKQCNKHPLAVLSLMIFVTSVVVYYQFLFTDKVFIYTDIGSDTKDVYYPFFMMLIRKISNRDFSMWDSTYGTGCNILSRQADTGSLFTWLACLFGEDKLKAGLVYVQILKIFLCGYFCYLYLGNFKFLNITKIIVAYIYAFNGFVMLWGQHYFFGSACVYVMLLLYSVEKALQEKKGYLYTAISVAIILCSSYYFGYMILLTVGIYTIFRLLHIYSWKERKSALKKIGGLAVSVLIGGCMSCFLFLPSVYYVMNVSSRLNGNMGLWERITSYLGQVHTMQTYHSVISRMYSNSLQGTTDYVGGWNYYEAPQLFFTSYNVAILLLFFLEIFWDKKRSRKIKILNILEICICSLFLLLPIGALIMNGFSVITFRFTYVFLPLFGLYYAEVIEKVISRTLSSKKVQVIASGLVSLLVLAVSLRYSANYTTIRVLKLCCFIFILFFVIVIYAYSFGKSIYGNILIMCMFALVIANITVEGLVSTNCRNCKDIATYQVDGDANVKAAIQYIHEKDSSYYRIEKTFMDASVCNDSMLEGYMGISAYNSVMNGNITEFANEIWPELWTGDLGCILGFANGYRDVNMATLMGIKYILSKEMIMDIPEYEYVDTVGDVFIYQNTCVRSFAQFYSMAIDYDDFGKLSSEEKDVIINNALVLKDAEIQTSTEDRVESVIEIKSAGNSGKIQGSVAAESDGWLFMPIPFEKGWKAYVDGKETDIEQADIGFSAILLSAGKHKIMFQYSSPMLKEGIIVSLFGLLLFVVWYIVLYNNEIKNFLKRGSVND